MSTLQRIFAPKRPLIWGLVLTGTAQPGWAPVTYTPRYMGVIASGVL